MFYTHTYIHSHMYNYIYIIYNYRYNHWSHQLRVQSLSAKPKFNFLSFLLPKYNLHMFSYVCVCVLADGNCKFLLICGIFCTRQTTTTIAPVYLSFNQPKLICLYLHWICCVLQCFKFCAVPVNPFDVLDIEVHTPTHTPPHIRNKYIRKLLSWSLKRLSIRQVARRIAFFN